jgi:hypothetical protein
VIVRFTIEALAGTLGKETSPRLTVRAGYFSCTYFGLEIRPLFVLGTESIGELIAKDGHHE